METTVSDDLKMTDEPIEEIADGEKVPPSREAVPEAEASPAGESVLGNSEQGAGETARMGEAEQEETLDLPAQLAQARAQAEEYLEGWQRARAEFMNYRKRVEREREEVFQQATMNLLKQLLPIVDDMERAVENIPEDIANHSWAQGVVLIGQKFQALLDSSGLKEINAVGEPFDPTRHEAIGTDDCDNFESGHITEVLQKGYVYGDKVLRSALVRVAN